MANTYTDEVKSKLVLNILESDEQYSSLVQVADNELYLTPDNHDEEIAGKQDKLTSANAGTNVTITEEGGVVKINAAGGGAEYTPGTGISITNNVISVTNPTLTNTATGIASTTIRGTPATAMSALNIGPSSEAGQSAVALGDSAKALGSRTIAIGGDAKITSNTVRGSIQLGYGLTSNSGEFNVGLGNDGSQYDNYTLLKYGGKIPTERLADNGTTGQILKKTTTGMEWANESSGGATSLEDLTDVNIDTPTNNQALIYDAENDEWVNGTVTATGVKSENVEYINGDFTTVKDALDSLLYKEFSVTLSGGHVYESGGSVTNPTVTWRYTPGTKSITSQILKVGSSTPVSISLSETSYTYSGTISLDTTFILTASDGKTTKNAQTSFLFQPRRYWGALTSSTLTDAQILTWADSSSNSDISSSRQMTKTFDCSGGKYIYIVLPTSLCSGIKFKVVGWDYEFPASDIETRTITTKTGGSLSVNIYRTPQYTSDSVSVQVL